MEQKILDINVQMVIVFQVEIIPIGTVIAHQPKLGTHQLWSNVFVSKIIMVLGLAMTMEPTCGGGPAVFCSLNKFKLVQMHFDKKNQKVLGRDKGLFRTATPRG